MSRELADAREQQAATAEILGLIANSPNDLQAILDMVAKKAADLCDAVDAQIFRVDGDLLRLSASFGPIPVHFDAQPIGRDWVTGRAVVDRQTIHIRDLAAVSKKEFPLGRFLQQQHGHRTTLATPLLQRGVAIGSILIRRMDVKPFSDSQIRLLETFANQAAVAIEHLRLFQETQARSQELAEALERQTATSEVLQVISASQGALGPVFESVLENAVRICGAEFGILFQLADGEFHAAAMVNVPEAYWEHLKSGSHRFGRGTATGRAAMTRKVVHIADLKAETGEDDESVRSTSVELGGARTIFSVPMLQDDKVAGAITIYRKHVEPFTDKQIDLVSNFASQAVIAIENARLLEELQESLQHQTATADVLKVISRSAFDLQSVLDTLTESAARLCEAENAWIFRRFGDVYRFAASYGFSPKSAAKIKEYLKPLEVSPGPGTLIGRTATAGKPIQIEDVLTDSKYSWRELQEIGGYRTALGVPLLRDSVTVGILALSRPTVRSFSEKQIDLAATFADQAVIAIENVRLFEEVQARTRELSEALEQQTATSGILSVISSSVTDTQPVFEAIVQSGMKLFPGAMICIAIPEGDIVRAAAVAMSDPASVKAWRDRFPIPLKPEYMHSLAILERKTMDVPDAAKAPEEIAAGARNFLASGYRAITAIPLLRGEDAIGALSVSRPEPGPLTDKQHAILKTFANQAVIAIENTRLLKELRESLQTQTATADVLKVISRSAFDLPTVLKTLVEAAARLCVADQGTIAREQDGVFHRVASHGFSEQFNLAINTLPVIRDRGSAAGRALSEGHIVHIHDVQADPEYTFTEARELGGFRTILAVPMLRDGDAIGVLVLTRIERRPFTEKQVELATTFADQAAIAIENVRLFENAEARTRELAKSLEELRTAQDRLVQTEKLASLGQLTAGIAHEIKNPLNFVNNFSSVSNELIDELYAALQDLEIDGAVRAEIEELSEMLKGNLDKIVQHGKRADSIVKNMLMHARQGSEEHRRVDINAVVEESLNLAYHGARAERQGFNITLERSLDPAAGEVDIFPQEITRVLLNLISNGFYAATKRKAEDGGGRYEPVLKVATRDLGDRIEIAVRDNGTGIPTELKEQLFSPFFTTKPVGEGTGLGLSISHDIVVKRHAGSIEVESEPGAFTEFRITLPRAGASLVEGSPA
jgi:GAF domain-containing protein